MPPSHKVHSSLRYALTRTLLVWAGLFFVLVGIIFLLTFDDVRSYMMRHVAEYRLDYQTQEFGKHLRDNEPGEIAEESDELVQDPQVAGIIVADTGGKLIHVSLHDDSLSQFSAANSHASGLLEKINNTPHLHVFQANIPNSDDRLYLVLDDRPITHAIQTSSIIASMLLLMLLLLSIYALHRVLRIQLVEPLEQLRGIMESGEAMPDRVIAQLEESLPSEAGEILATYDQLVHDELEMAGRFHDMLDRVPGCVWSASTGLKYTEVSSRAGEVFGHAGKELLGHELWSWLPDVKQRRHNIRRLRKAISDNAPILYMSYSIRVDGNDRWYGENIGLTYSYDTSSDKNRLEGLFGISSDITRRKAEESEIEGIHQRARKMEAISTLVGGIAHEFNNMLAGIIGNVFLLKSDFEPGSKAAQRLARIEKLGNRAAGLVEQLLAFGRRNRMMVRNVELLPLLNQVQAIESAGLPEHVRLIVDTKDHTNARPVVRADATQLKQVLGSLISNAADACAGKADAEISIGVQDVAADKSLAARFPQLEDNPAICIFVRDNGAGIPAEHQERVFEPFFTTKEVGRGTGMGLSMAYGLIHSLGGAMELKSKEGVGTTVYLYLQQAHTPPAVEEVAEPSPTLHYGQGQTVLVADDETLLRVAAQEVLAALHYKPVVVDDGQAAVDYVREHGEEVSIVLLDLIMPGISGGEAAGRIRLLYPRLPIVFVTGFNLSEDGTANLNLPLSRIVTKPYQTEHLSQVMAELLQEANRDS